MHLAFFDIDGALALGKYVPDSAKEGIRQLREKGDLVFICTGRNVHYVRANFGEYADGFITNNGRLAYYRDEVIFDAPLEKKMFRKIMKILREENAGFVFHDKNNGYYEGPEELYELMKEVGDPGYLKWHIDEDKEYYNFDICLFDSEHCERIRKALENYCILNPHGPHPSADMSVFGTDKGDALKAVAGKLGVDINDTYAFGDGLNDVCMMKAAGHGIAMGNGQDLTKQAAEYITSDINEDGVYLGLKHYGLI